MCGEDSREAEAEPGAERLTCCARLERARPPRSVYGREWPARRADGGSGEDSWSGPILSSASTAANDTAAEGGRRGCGTSPKGMEASPHEHEAMVASRGAAVAASAAGASQGLPEAEEALEDEKLPSAPLCDSLLGRARRRPLRLHLREPNGDECAGACDMSVITAAATHSAGGAPGGFTTASTRTQPLASIVEVAIGGVGRWRRPLPLLQTSSWSTEPWRGCEEGVKLGAPPTTRFSRCASTASTARESSDWASSSLTARPRQAAWCPCDSTEGVGVHKALHTSSSSPWLCRSTPERCSTERSSCCMCCGCGCGCGGCSCGGGGGARSIPSKCCCNS